MKIATFIDDVLDGKARIEDIDNYIDTWHTSEIPLHLYQYLGIRRSDYTAFLHSDKIIEFIIKNRKNRDNPHIVSERKICTQ